MDYTKCCMCHKELPDYNPSMCCDGFECGCRGLPLDPPVCSPECEDNLYAGKSPTPEGKRNDNE